MGEYNPHYRCYRRLSLVAVLLLLAGMGVASWQATLFLFDEKLGIQIGGFGALGVSALVTLFLAFLALSNDTDYNMQCYILMTSVFGIMFLIIGVVEFVRGSGSDDSRKAAIACLGLAGILFLNTLIFHLVYITDEFSSQHLKQGRRIENKHYAETHQHGTTTIMVTPEELEKIPEQYRVEV